MIEKPGEGPLVPSWDEMTAPHKQPTYVIPKTSKLTPSTYQKPEWKCLGVLAGSLKLYGSEHELPFGMKPEQPTTAEDGKWMTGHCEVCHKRTVWKAL